MREGFILPCHRHSPDEGSLSGESTPCRWAKHCWILGRHTSIHGQSRKPTAISGCSRLVASEQVVFLASGNTKTAGSPEILPLSLTHQSQTTKFWENAGKTQMLLMENMITSATSSGKSLSWVQVKGACSWEMLPIQSCWHAEG